MGVSNFRKFISVSAKRAASLFSRPPSPVNAESFLNNNAVKNAIDAFHVLWYVSPGSGKMTWMGCAVLKNPIDMWLYQEILVDRRPDILIETGTHHGGSALFFAGIARLAEFPMKVITIDFNPKIAFDAPRHDIFPITAISTTSGAIAQVSDHIQQSRSKLGREPRVMVVLDSDHSMKNVSEELAVYSKFVTLGDYLVVEDTNINGHPTMPDHGPGPYEAVEQFLSTRADFVRDPVGDKFLLTQNPGGWLRRVPKA
jgi:cephalosporin hydroxylase